ncbi:MAG: GyrI-like domain-containing protein [Thermoplasmata archaeon]|nr:GyrI-like domain-containing protein [Thermoplasmata archaeon]
MTVDFELKKSPKTRVASIDYRGPWKENHLRKEFGDLVRWATANKVKTGAWIFRERGEKRHQACLVLKGPATSKGRVKIRTIPATWVARVTFDPEVVSPRVIYHGLNDWTKWRKKDKTIKGVGTSREVYAGDPWSDKKAWSMATVEFVVRK